MKDVCIFRVDGGAGMIRVMRHECETYKGVLFRVLYKRRRAYGGTFERASDAVRKAMKLAESHCCQLIKNDEWV